MKFTRKKHLPFSLTAVTLVVHKTSGEQTDHVLVQTEKVNTEFIPH